jgi:Ser/Thr protein kinase RdoA (MazF antagonist)
LLVYPWVEGVVAMERRLTGRQWAGLGRFMAALHRAERLGRAVAAARPRERDLLFATGPQRARFLEGYGPVTLDRPTVAYYRWEWVVQELAELRRSRPRRPARGRHQAACPGGAPAAVRAR